jgi:transposase
MGKLDAAFLAAMEQVLAWYAEPSDPAYPVVCFNERPCEELEGMMGGYDRTDEQYALIEPHLPSNTKQVGHPYGEHRPIINGICWRLHTGAPWPDIPEGYDNWKTIYDRYPTWRREGIWDRVMQALQRKLDEDPTSGGLMAPWFVRIALLPGRGKQGA